MERYKVESGDDFYSEVYESSEETLSDVYLNNDTLRENHGGMNIYVYCDSCK